MKEDYFYIKNFLFILFGYFFIHLVVRVLISPNVGLDEAEQLLLTQSFAWGYNSQPPLYTWLQIIFFQLFGTNVFALAFLKNTLLFFTYFFVYKSAKLVTNNATLAIIASASLVLLPQISWESQRALTHSVLLTSISSIVIYMIFKIKYSEEKIHIGYYFLLGVLISIGMLTKYSFSLFIFSVLIASLLDQKLRSFIFKKELVITLSIIILFLLPHIVWFVDHISLVTSSTINKLTFKNETFSFIIGISNLFKAILAFLAPLLIITILTFRKSLHHRGNTFLFHFFIIVIITLIIFTFFTGSTNFKDRWMQPYFFLMVIYLASKINIETVKKFNITLYFKIIYLLMFIIIVVSIARVYFPDITKRHSRLNYPYHELAKQIKKDGFMHGSIIAEDKWIAGNMKLNFLSSTVFSKYFDKNVDKSGKLLIIWKDKFPDQAKQYKHLIKEQKVIDAHYLYSATNDYKLNIAIVHNEN